MTERFADMLAGGHPNSLGRTIEVVDTVLAAPDRMTELFECYHSDDPVIRLRTSNAMKRVEAARHDLIVLLVDRLVSEVGPLNQASAQWTFAQLFLRLTSDLTPAHRSAATSIIQRNLTTHDDWIVLKTSMETLGAWAKTDHALRTWLAPHLRRHADDRRKTVSARARKELKSLGLT